MDAKLPDRFIRLTDEALDALASQKTLSAVVQKAIRIARLRGDWENLWWLEFELCSYEEASLTDLRNRLLKETASHFARTEIEGLIERTLTAYRATRSTVALENRNGIKKGAPVMSPGSVQDIERGIDQADRAMDQLAVRPGLHLLIRRARPRSCRTSGSH